MTRGVARMLAVAALVPLALPARAVADSTFTANGSVTYTWQGDPARGCGADGLCGVQGSLIVQSQGGVSSSGGPRGGPIDVPIGTSGATVRVSDGAGAGECIDMPSGPGPGGDLVIARGPGGALVGHVGPSLSSGRCAGPRQQDLAAVALPVKRLGGRHPSYDLRANRTFVAGPFSGRMVSTLVVRAAPGASQTVSSGPSPPTSPPRHKVFIEHVTLRYRLASLPGSLDIAFSGESDPFCMALDSCGASGTLALALPGFQRTLMVDASRQVSRRVDARQALADFRHGRLPAGGGETGNGGARDIAQVTETFAGSGGRSCQDTSESRNRAQLFLVPGSPRPGRGVGLGLNDPFGAGMLRTHCQGPSDSDVLGTFPGVASASIGFATLLSGHSVLSLRAPGSFAGFGYVGTRSGALRFSLTLQHVSAGTMQVVRP